MMRRASLVTVAVVASIVALTSPARTQATFDATLEPARATAGDHLTLTITAHRSSEARLEVPSSPDEPEPLNPAEPRDLKEPLQASLGGVPSWVLGALFMAGFVCVSVLTIVFARVPARGSPPPFQSPAAPNEPPDEVARRELDAIAASGHLDRGELAEYYQRMAACLRQYLADRFDVPAVAMMPQELQSGLEALDIDQLPIRLAVNILQQSQAVQFEGHEPTRDRAESDLSAAHEIVRLTGRLEPSERAGNQARTRP